MPQQKILVGTADGLYEIGEKPRTAVAGHEITSLAGGAARWAVVDGREIWRQDPAAGWSPVVSLHESRANCVLETPGGVSVGASEARLFAMEKDALEPVRSFDSAPGRSDWFTPWGGPPDVRSMSADPSGTVYANVHVGGVVRSRDGGGSWEPTLDIHADVHQVLFDPGRGLLLAASAQGLGVSDDFGDSWRFDDEGLHGRYLRAVAVVDDIVLVSASTCPRTSRAAVYRRPASSEGAFERCGVGLPEWFGDNIDTYCLVASSSIASFGTSEGSVFASSDQGRSWNPVAEGLPPVRSVAFA